MHSILSGADGLPESRSRTIIPTGSAIVTFHDSTGRQTAYPLSSEPRIWRQVPEFVPAFRTKTEINWAVPRVRPNQTRSNSAENVNWEGAVEFAGRGQTCRKHRRPRSCTRLETIQPA
jgi:hypothetical protein